MGRKGPLPDDAGPSRLQRVHDAALALLQAAPDGCRFTVLRRTLGEQLPDIPDQTIMRVITGLAQSGKALRPQIGLYVLNPSWEPPPSPDLWEAGVGEWRFYRGLAEFIGALEGCTRVAVVGGNRLGRGERWGTPDVVGRISAAPGCIAPWSDMLVSCELKCDRGEVLRGYGQACAYKLFSHKSYLAVPQDCSADDLRRLELLCVQGQVGLVLFDAEATDAPRWQLRLRPMCGCPDPGQLNEKLALLKAELY